MIGIIGAMEEEIAGLKKSMENITEEQRAGMTFFRGIISGKECVLVCSGIGKVNAAACTQILADRYCPDCIINTGIAGGLKEGVEIGDIVLSVDAVQHDMDCVGFGYPVGVIPRMAESFFRADEGLLELAERCCRQENPGIGVHPGRVASGDCFVSDPEKKKQIRDRFDAFCCEMEGAAIAQTACLNGIPWIIIRAISDRADGTAAEQYERFQGEAISHFLKLTVAMLKNL